MSVATTARAICKEAAIELGIQDPIEPQPADKAIYFLNKLNRLLDNLNAERCAVYNENFATYTLIPSLQPHTIGPASATFTVSQRPVSIEGANIILPETVKSPLTVRDDEWWLGNLVPAITSALPTDLYYSATWPNGSIYLWPIPTVAYGLELETRQVLSNVTLDDTINLPPGYKDLLVLCLAEDNIVSFGKGADPSMGKLIANAAKVRARVYANNDTLPRLVTQDAGIPTGSRQLPYFNWRAGWPR